MKKVILFLTLIFLINGCSKDDNPSSEQEQIIDGGTAKTSQLVVINNSNITENLYQATLGSQSISIVKTAENELVFKVPNEMEVGEQILTIPNLNNLKIKYQIIENVLTGTAEENLSTYFSNVQSHLTSIEGTLNYEYVNGYFQRFDEVFQNLTESEKMIMAKFYKANQSRFDNILTTDFSGRVMFGGSDFELLLRFSAATIGFGVSAAIAILDPVPLTKVIAMGVCIIAWSTAIDYKQEFADRNIKKLNVLIDGLASLLQGRNMMNELELTSGVSASFPLESETRQIINSDTNDENQNVADYFSKHNTYNSTVESLNGAINFINNNFFLTDFDLIPISVINNTNPVETALENEEFYNRINFSIESDNVNIDNISFSNGNINITTSIVDPSIVTEFVETHINFSYEDDFNRLTGSYPVKIFIDNTIDISLSGSWLIVGPNNSSLIGTVTSFDCNTGDNTGQENNDFGQFATFYFSTNNNGASWSTPFETFYGTYQLTSDGNLTFNITLSNAYNTGTMTFNGAFDTINSKFNGSFGYYNETTCFSNPDQIESISQFQGSVDMISF